VPKVVGHQALRQCPKNVPESWQSKEMQENGFDNTLVTIEKKQGRKQSQETTQALVLKGLAKYTPQDSNL
jgi:hypothetical protein